MNLKILRFGLKFQPRGFKCFYFSKTRRHLFYVIRNIYTLSPRTNGFQRTNSYTIYKDQILLSLKRDCWVCFGFAASFYAFQRTGLKNSTSPQELGVGRRGSVFKTLLWKKWNWGITDCSKLTLLQNKCLFCFHRAQLTILQNNLVLSSGRVITISVVAGNNIYCPDYSLWRIPCNQISETLLSKNRVPTGLLTLALVQSRV